MKPRLLVPPFVGALLLVLGTLAAACGDDEEKATPTPEAEGEAGVVSVVLDDDESTGSIVDEETGAPTFTVNAGEITFEVHNEGSRSHNLVIIRTDLAVDALPIVGDFRDELVDEEAAGEKIGEIEEFRGGGAIEVDSFTLTPGRYALICNLFLHYQSGMFAELTVEE